MEQQVSNHEILEKLNEMQLDIDIIKEKLGDEGEFSNWAKEELESARKRTDKVSHEEVKKMILAK